MLSWPRIIAWNPALQKTKPKLGQHPESQFTAASFVNNSAEKVKL